MKKKMVIIIGSLVLVIGLLALGMKMKNNQGYVLESPDNMKTAMSELHDIDEDEIKYVFRSDFQRDNHDLCVVSAKTEGQIYLSVFEMTDKNRYHESYGRKLENNKGIIIFDDYHEVVIGAFDDKNKDIKLIRILSKKYGKYKMQIETSDPDFKFIGLDNTSLHIYDVELMDKDEYILDYNVEKERITKEDIGSLN